nr:hypothetical protein [Tanacetum cinerariifolium]
MKRAPEFMQISGFMHGVNNPKLTKSLNEHVPKTMEEMMITTTAFIRGEAAAVSKKKGHTSWRTQDQSKRKTSEKRTDFRGHPREGRGSSRFTPLTRTPKEIFAVEAGKFQPPPLMVTPVEKRSNNKFCDFHNDKGHSTDECMQLKKQIEELHGRDQSKAGKKETPSKDKPAAIYMIQSWKRMTRQKVAQSFERSKAGKKETPSKDKPAAIYMIQSWKRMTRQKVAQSFERVREITFPPLTTSSGAEGLLVIEAKIAGHMIHRMYVDGGSSMEILYERCFNRLWPEFKNQMALATTSLTGFSRETIWPLGQLRLLAVPSTAHEMLKFPVDGGIVTIRSTISIPTEWYPKRTSYELIEQRVSAIMSYRKKKWGMSKNEGCSPLFIVVWNLGGQGDLVAKLGICGGD